MEAIYAPAAAASELTIHAAAGWEEMIHAAAAAWEDSIQAAEVWLEPLHTAAAREERQPPQQTHSRASLVHEQPTPSLPQPCRRRRTAGRAWRLTLPRGRKSGTYRCRRPTPIQALPGSSVAAQFAGHVKQDSPLATAKTNTAHSGSGANGNLGSARCAALSRTTRPLREKGGKRRSGGGPHRTERRLPSNQRPTSGGLAGTGRGPRGPALPRRPQGRTRNATGACWRTPRKPPPLRQKPVYRTPPLPSGSSRTHTANPAATKAATRPPHPTTSEHGAPAADGAHDVDVAAAATAGAEETAGTGALATKAMALGATAAEATAGTTEEEATAATTRPTTTTTPADAPTARRPRVRLTGEARVERPAPPGEPALAEDGPDAAAAAAEADGAPRRRRQPEGAERQMTPTTRASSGPPAAPGRPRHPQTAEVTAPLMQIGRCGWPAWGRPNGRRVAQGRSRSPGKLGAPYLGAPSKGARTRFTPTCHGTPLARSPHNLGRQATATTSPGGPGDPAAASRNAPLRRARARAGDDDAEEAGEALHRTRGATSTTSTWSAS